MEGSDLTPAEAIVKVAAGAAQSVASAVQAATSASQAAGSASQAAASAFQAAASATQAAGGMVSLKEGLEAVRAQTAKLCERLFEGNGDSLITKIEMHEHWIEKQEERAGEIRRARYAATGALIVSLCGALVSVLIAVLK